MISSCFIHRVNDFNFIATYYITGPDFVPKLMTWAGIVVGDQDPSGTGHQPPEAIDLTDRPIKAATGALSCVEQTWGLSIVAAKQSRCRFDWRFVK